METNTSKPILVTPDMAKEFLTKNTHNRHLSMDRVRYYAKLIKEGKWKLTTDAIGFTKSGVLCNGQTRLHAIVSANEPALLYVAYGLDEDAINCIDQGRKRTSSDAFVLAGIKNAKTQAAAIKIIVEERFKQMFAGGSNKSGERYATDDLLDFYEQNSKRCEDTMVLCRSIYDKQPCHQINISSIYALIWYMENKGWDKQTIETFLVSALYQNKTNMEMFDKLFRILMDNKNDNIHMSATTMFKMLAYCFNRYIKKKDVKTIAYNNIGQVDFIENNGTLNL